MRASRVAAAACRRTDSGVKTARLPARADLGELSRGWLRGKEYVLHLHSPNAYDIVSRLGRGVLPAWEALSNGGRRRREREGAV
jgi:hypothetical protein